MHAGLERLAKVALMFWAIVTWVTGYVFAPVMFAKFDKTQAGLNTGELLHTTYVISVVCAIALLIDMRVRFKQQLLHLADLWLTLGALFIVIVQYAGISPKMLALKQTMLSNPTNASAFMQWHGASQLLYLLTSALLAILVWRRLLK